MLVCNIKMLLVGFNMVKIKLFRVFRHFFIGDVDNKSSTSFGLQKRNYRATEARELRHNCYFAALFVLMRTPKHVAAAGPSSTT